MPITISYTVSTAIYHMYSVTPVTTTEVLKVMLTIFPVSYMTTDID